MANKTLSAAKKAKKNEFYTQYADIDREMQAYLTYDANVFRGKTILLPCDDPEWSNFTKYFAENFEFVLGGETDTRLLNVRCFDEKTKKVIYAKQTDKAKKKGVSNCPLCALGHDANAARIWELKEMDADHVTAWSKGGETSAANCQLLCKTHNRAKGNK